jgi:hypothetical protein
MSKFYPPVEPICLAEARKVAALKRLKKLRHS